MKRCVGFLLVIAFAVSAACCLADADDPPVVGLDSGRIEGFRQGPVNTFLGVPYAATTAGENRWRAPRPVEPWSGVRAATRFAADCEQDLPYAPPGGSPWTDEFLSSGPMSEDCLFLNVWAPAEPAGPPAPVLVWIHGGGFAGGSGSIPIYNGRHLAGMGIVVVTINYRVAVFGFLAHPELTAEAGSSGNYGLMDQVAALQWVQRNIGAFGGDPQRVTIAGQSAGAASVHDLIASPLAKGLFSGAIAESGSGMGIPADGLADAEALGAKVAAFAGAASIAELRALPADRVAEASHDPAIGPPGLRYRPIREAAVLPDPDIAVNKVPVLTGFTGDEGSASPAWATSTLEDWQALLGRLFGTHSGSLGSLYPVQADAGVHAMLREILRDRTIAAMVHWAAPRSKQGLPTFGYLFAHVPPGPDPERFGAFHTSEVPYVFGTLEAGERDYGAADRGLSDTMMAYWVNFIGSGDPNGDGLAQWPDLRSGDLMWFGDSASAGSALGPEQRAAFQAFVDDGGKLGLFP